jgi:hypothetical protein
MKVTLKTRFEWLRELERNALIEGIEVNLDEDNHPAHAVPEWVMRLE